MSEQKSPQQPARARPVRRGREQRRRIRTATPVVHTTAMLHETPFYEILDAEGVELIHNASMRILEETGIEFRDAEALAIWRNAGPDVAGELARNDRDPLMGLISRPPERSMLTGRKPA